jgi:DNA ligase (NAD+)
LHNEDEIAKKDVRIGDTVLVQRAGDVIPEVVKVITSKRSGAEKKFTMPPICPVCGSAIIRIAGEAAVRCVNSSCSAQVKERIKHFASKGAFDIDGLGDKLVEQLVDKGLLRSYAEVFQLDAQTLAGLERMGAKSAANLMQAIGNSKRIRLARFLFALGIRHVGEHVAAILAGQFRSLEELLNCTKEDLTVIPGIGDVVAESIVNFFKQAENLNTIQRLLDNGVQIVYEANQQAGRLDGKVFVLTGSLDRLTRPQAKELIEGAGGKVGGAVSRRTDFLVVGAAPGSKLQRARELRVTVIDEAALLEMLGR